MYITDVISGTMADNDTNYLNNSSCPELTVNPSVSLKTNRTLAHFRFGFATKRFLWVFFIYGGHFLYIGQYGTCSLQEQRKGQIILIIFFLIFLDIQTL